MKYHSYKWIFAFLACACLFFLGIISIHNSSLVYAQSALATPSTRSTMPSIVTPEVRPTPTMDTASQAATHSTNSDPSTAIAIIGLIIAFIGLVVQGVTLFLIYRYVRDTASMAQATRDSANATQASAKVAENTLQEMKESREEENAPFVVVYFNYLNLAQISGKVLQKRDLLKAR
jgi:hypothetical protein